MSESASVKSLEWYFAYGSNLAPDTFCRRRRMQPRDVRRGCLRDFSLTFDLPVGPSNRGVANIALASGDEVWGVAYQISAADGRRLDRSEGVHRNYYQRVAVTIDVDGGGSVEAFTYSSPRGRRGRLPSARYLGLLVTGARYHQLPDPWLERLQAWPLAIDEREQRQRDLF